MKIIRTLKITSDEFYDYLENELLEIANKNRTGKIAYTPANITAGFSTTKGEKESLSKIDLTITSYIRGSLYAADTASATGTSHLSYSTKETADGLEVTFEQILPDNSGKKKKRNRLLGGFSDALYLSRMSNSLYDIQNKIIKERKS